MNWLVKFFLICIWLSQPLAFAQETPSDSPPSPPQQEQTQESDKDTDFFDAVDAPVTYKGAFIKMMLTLLALLVLIVVSVWMLRRISHGRMKQMNYGRAIKVIERRPLSAKSVLYLVEISGKKVVIAESQLDVRPITTADHLSLDET